MYLHHLNSPHICSPSPIVISLWLCSKPKTSFQTSWPPSPKF